jgi:hypothetical protein
MTVHSTLYSCDICGQPYQGSGTGGVTTWSWAGIALTMDLCPACVARVRDAIQAVKIKISGGDAQEPKS